MRGNVVELAIAVVIGTAFTAVVTQFSKSFVEPLIKLLSGGKPVSGTFELGSGVVMDWGAFVNAAISFLITAAVVYFLFVMPMNKLAERRARGEEPKPKAPSEEVRLLTEIRDALVARERGLDPGDSSVPVKPERV
jgi:large conductance mechanosensitive channel